MKSMITLLLVIFITSIVFGQERLVNKKLDELFTCVSTKRKLPADESILYKSQNHALTLQKMEVWVVDTMPDLRLLAGKIMDRIGLKTTDQSLRQKSVTLLLKLCGDPDTRIANYAGLCLKNYSYLDFDNDAQLTIRNYIKRKTFGYDNMLRVAGYLNISDIMGVIKEKISSGMLSRKEKWTAYLVLARLGDGNAIDYCLNEVKKLKISNNLVYDILPDLVYTHQRKCFDYLIEIIQNNEPLCESANPEAPGKILCGYRVMEYLAPVVENFPLKTSISGDIIAKDYKQALKETREWFKKHPDYKIIANKF